MNKGKLIVIEGPDGTGKTTLAQALVQKLASKGIEAHSLREPGGTLLSEDIRLIIKGIRLNEEPLSERAEVLLFCAARAQLCAQVIAPSLKKGKWIILDRFEGSTLVYQGLGRGLGVDNVRLLSQFARDNIEPDRVLLLEAASETREKRQSSRGEKDRIEKEDELFQKKIEEGYLWLQNEPQTKVVDANDSPQAILNSSWRAISDLVASFQKSGA